MMLPTRTSTSTLTKAYWAEMASLACNVVLLPSEDISQKAIQTSQLLAEKEVLFTLAEGMFYPHVSIYMLQLKISDFVQAKQLLADLASSNQPPVLTATRFWQSKQFTDVEYDKSDTVGHLQRMVVSALNPIRDGMRVKDEKRMTEATGMKLENFKKYGWDSIGELYRPHLTFTRFTQYQNIDDLQLPPVSEFSGTFPAIGLCEMGANGTCVRKIATFGFRDT